MSFLASYSQQSLMCSAVRDPYISDVGFYLCSVKCTKQRPNTCTEHKETFLSQHHKYIAAGVYFCYYMQAQEGI